ncbi:MAG: 50S ribosomal protein L9 [Pseudodesulfovibrio sp.]|uniref:Large ribosomal subunit protein bL9 n=1 Tax=Pseudodesulfovibrio aespoeensis (strain ATCC 700646 / DSM 10631 / Aspo-2) TaxID=643562 RepID=E6VU48_PSEA9|nr:MULTISPECIES: 50S ribosomal protein L9 [Pseudodesulfovibrio]MBU4190938.1 50S ribosomal protein L9 [Pseudomonadota bacterium]ADU62241.1 ribosomal protein L9 [Pseudodesulfovibrio aespoeensis Aspo-2]MBU4379918.1 50S ribosomal protein L9 [Pseudomonadota bacterium]MBU4476069.1 50S ribosomal protein L9 [Pseudomonadota bacterium]MBU4515291.1 50S ribosomal protein L9 [Pseudomonadota bacterium]
MKLILRADVDALGRLGEIVTVKAGYGRNYLIPQGLAKPATPANLKAFELERRKLQENANSLRAQAQGLADRIAATPLTIEVRVGEGDKLYGSVTSTNIGDVLEAAGINIDRRKIVLSDPIRSLGEYEVEVKLHPDVHGELKLSVVRHGASIIEETAPAAKGSVAKDAQSEDAETAEA